MHFLSISIFKLDSWVLWRVSFLAVRVEIMGWDYKTMKQYLLMWKKIEVEIGRKMKATPSPLWGRDYFIATEV